MLQLLPIPPIAPGRGGALCGTFARLAGQVWTTLEAANKTGLSFGEESVTDAVLLDLALNHPLDIAIAKFTKWQEGKTTGADWEWWFGDKTAWFGMRVQAKVLDTPSLRYASLGHRVARSKKLQVNLLLGDAKKRGLFPAYCFYNFWDIKAVASLWNCRSRLPQTGALGCTVADARPIKNLIAKGKDDLGSVEPYAFPWTCLVCCTGGVIGPTSPSSPAVGFAGRVHAFAHRVLAPRELRGRVATNLVAAPPSYVQQVRATRATDVRVDGLPETVDGVMIAYDGETSTVIPEPKPKSKGRPRARRPG